MWHLPTGEKLANVDGRTMDPISSEVSMTTQEPSDTYKSSFDLTQDLMVDDSN